MYTRTPRDSNESYLNFRPKHKSATGKRLSNSVKSTRSNTPELDSLMGKPLTYHSMYSISEDYRLTLEQVEQYETLLRRYGPFTIMQDTNDVYADIPQEME